MNVGLFLEGFKFLNYKSASATSGYHEVYPVRTRSRIELFVVLALFIMLITIALIFALKKIK